MTDTPVILGQAGTEPLEVDIERLIGSHLDRIDAAKVGLHSRQLSVARFREKRRRERWEARQHALLERAPVEGADAIWAAGYFEGEGTATIYGGSQWGRPAASIASTDLETMEWFKQRWGGSICRNQPNSAAARPAFRWAVNAYFDIECFLRDIRPHIRRSLVQRKVDIVRTVIGMRARFPKDPAVLTWSVQMMHDLRRLNWRGTPDAQQRWQGRGRHPELLEAAE